MSDLPPVRPTLQQLRHDYEIATAEYLEARARSHRLYVEILLHPDQVDASYSDPGEKLAVLRVYADAAALDLKTALHHRHLAAKLVVLLLVCCAALGAEDRPWWGGYGGLGWSDSHHDNHFDTGAIMGGSGRLLLEPIAPGRSHLYKIGLATAVTAGWMVSFERVVANDGHGSLDLVDAAYGTAGGLAGAIAVDLGITGARFVFSPHRNGAAFTMNRSF